MHKRKHRRHARDWDSATRSSASHAHATDSRPGLLVQAHEAHIVRGQDVGNGLIRWPPSERPDDNSGHEPSQPTLWVDRYDVRLLLDPVPSVKAECVQTRPLSPSGWSDLPSDSEDTFFFSADEIEDYRREKRRKLMDRSREERLRALAAGDDQHVSDHLAASDEEPDETQRDLIRSTAAQIISSPNPVQMELRMLANYGSDKRFAFLRGRWPRVWNAEKERAKQYQAERMRLPVTLSALEGLAGYGDSDSNSDVSDKEALGGVTDAGEHTDISDDAVKEARRARAKEWAERRRAEQSSRLEQL